MPIAAAAPELFVVIALAILLVVLLTSVQLYLNGKQARAWSVSLPVISDPVTNAIDAIVAFIVNAAHVVDLSITAILTQAISGFGRLVVLSFNMAAGAFIELVRVVAQTAFNAWTLALAIERVELPALRQRVTDLENLEGAVSQAIQGFVAAAIVTALLPIVARLQALGATQTAQGAVVSTYRPMWDQLAAVPGGAAHAILQGAARIEALQSQVVTLQNDLGLARGRASVLENTVAQQQALLQRLAGLTALAAVGAVAIETLARIGRNPCEPCLGINLSDLEGRVASIEMTQT